jgi:hypothetical protein
MGEYCVIDVPELATIKIKNGEKLLVNGPPKEQLNFSVTFVSPSWILYAK